MYTLLLQTSTYLNRLAVIIVYVTITNLLAGVQCTVVHLYRKHRPSTDLYVHQYPLQCIECELGIISGS